ncbi:methyl-CpG-binding domain-containing protein 7 isoform X2 [Daucus carota subsp. sativus]|uniref:methyl-CpG-binding domain-containing protein 7 isoform X2 n=1 Tax=Daucus carota subsp. sativus TaxID=79200 RepID=UPI0007EF351D|nr:PREDICTED: methyl-CpG-binding domain-containing protein 7-like isoform X2 [Daucus carota subsp. sativus]
MEQGRGSPDMHVPMRLLLPGYSGANEGSDRRQLAVYNPPPPPPPSQPGFGGSRFKLPEGWEVEEVPRADASRIDKYYYEPSTGHKFRSLKEVERYINGEVYTPRRRRSKALKFGSGGSHGKSQSSTYRKMVVSGGKMLKLANKDGPDKYKMAIVPARKTPFSSPYQLPEGWVVEEVPRNTHGGYVDKYYYEPGTGRKFRSLSSVDRHLADQNENTRLSETPADLRAYNMPLSNAYKIGSHVKNSNSFWKNNNQREEVQSATFNSPPLKINWVIASPGGNTWSPFIGGSLVPQPVQQQWCKRYMLSINDGRYIAPNF